MNEPTTEKPAEVTFTIDNIPVTVPKGTTVYMAARQLGIEIPIFCYQDRMPPFGACRVCLVEVEKMPKLQTSCTLEATEGMVVRTRSDIATKGRQEILEFLLINHPLDCPICDRGGECPLQDQVLKYGPGESRFYEDKRRFVKPVPLGSVLMLDRERCIVCARCTRFGDRISGDHALELIDRGFRTEVGTPHGQPVESKFIGNTIAICPVGALTSQVYRFRARPWDNQPTKSTCTLCPVGCSLILDARDGEIMRTRVCENKIVNDIWLCDKGWFGYEFSSSPDRLDKPLIRREGRLEPASWDEALRLIADKIQAAKPAGKIAGIGGNPLTTEENYLFQQLIREGTGVNNLDHRVGMPIISLEQEGLSPRMEISLADCENLSFAVLLGVDLTEEFPLIWLRLKQAVNRGATVLFLGHYAPEIASHLSLTVLHPPGKELDILKEQLPYIASLAEKGMKGALFVGRQYLASPERLAILSEISQFKKDRSNVSLNILEGQGNSYGARWAGMRPDLAPQNKPLDTPGLNVNQVLESAAKDGWDLLYVAGANPAKLYPSEVWKAARERLGFLVVQDIFLNETAQEADVVLPTLAFVEKEGTFLSIEGRVQPLRPGKKIPDEVLSDGEIFVELAKRLNLQLALSSEFIEKLAQERILLDRNDPVSTSRSAVQNAPEGALRATFAKALFDHGVRMLHNEHLVELAKPPRIRIHPMEASKRNLKDGDTITIRSNGRAVTGAIKFDKRVAKETVVLPLGFPELPVHDLGINLLNGLVVEMTDSVAYI